ncbi:MAG: hypothetical protein F6J93_00100 [Oscillatoria sp. SIO1A7]|nr:hypothetical protein [Oscillatoria sp. SIO1A7]
MSLKENIIIDSTVERAILLGTQQASKAERETKAIAICLTESQEGKIEELCNVFGLSVRSMLNSAVKYVLFYREKQGLDISKLKEYPQNLGSRSFKLDLNAETFVELRKAGAIEPKEIAEYAITGITLLYEQNINIKPI